MVHGLPPRTDRFPRPPVRTIPRGEGRVLYFVKGEGKSFRQPSPCQLLPAAGVARRAHPADGDHRRECRMDRRQNEVEPFFLEFQPHQAAQAPVNILLKDDRATRTRGHPRRGLAEIDGICGARSEWCAYFGPYAARLPIRATLDLLLRTFPIRTCTKAKFDRPITARASVSLRAHREVRVPLLGDIDQRRYDKRRHDLLELPRRRSPTRSSSARTEDV